MDRKNGGRYRADDVIFFETVRDCGDEESRFPKANDGVFVIDVASLIYLCLLLPGNISANAFTVAVGVICAARLVRTFIGRIFGQNC